MPYGQQCIIPYGGYGGIFRKINAEQSIEWEVSYSTSDYTAHHDVEYLSNGNIIFPAWGEISQTEAAEEGFGGSYNLNPESIIEMNPPPRRLYGNGMPWII